MEKLCASIAASLIGIYLVAGASYCLAPYAALLNHFDKPNPWGLLRDNFFITYPANLIFGMGIVGGPFVLWLLYRKISQGRAGWQPAFWWLAIPFCVAVGIASTGEPDPLGVAHLTLLTVNRGTSWPHAGGNSVACQRSGALAALGRVLH